MQTYDPSQVTVTVKGRYITGFAEGSMVEWEKDEENFSAKVSAKGEVSVALSNNPLGTITILLSQTSPDTAYLKKLANTNEVFPIWVKSGTERVGGSQAMVKKTPDGALSDEAEDREFEIQVFDYTDE